jgi:hypothetical protein
MFGSTTYWDLGGFGTEKAGSTDSKPFGLSEYNWGANAKSTNRWKAEMMTVMEKITVLTGRKVTDIREETSNGCRRNRKDVISDSRGNRR